MKPVKTRPRFNCDFCRRISTEAAMKKHEIRCFKNPNRYCELCDNKGYTTECHGDLIEEGDCGLSEDVPCPYCKTADEIKEQEKRDNKQRKELESQPSVDIKDIPF